MNNDTTETTTTTATMADKIVNHINEKSIAGHTDSGNSFMSLVRLGVNTVKLVPLAVNATARVADYTHGLVISTNTGSTLNNINMLDTLSIEALAELEDSMVKDIKISYDKACELLSSEDETKTKRVRK